MAGEFLLQPVPSPRATTPIPSLTFFKKMCKRRGRIKDEVYNRQKEIKMIMGREWGRGVD
jgi:hypothetical protein